MKQEFMKLTFLLHCAKVDLYQVIFFLVLVDDVVESNTIKFGVNNCFLNLKKIYNAYLIFIDTALTCKDVYNRNL